MDPDICLPPSIATDDRVGDLSDSHHRKFIRLCVLAAQGRVWGMIPARSERALAHELHTNRLYMNRFVDAMIEIGLVSRQADRSLVITLFQDGGEEDAEPEEAAAGGSGPPRPGDRAYRTAAARRQADYRARRRAGHQNGHEQDGHEQNGHHRQPAEDLTRLPDSALRVMPTVTLSAPGQGITQPQQGITRAQDRNALAVTEAPERNGLTVTESITEGITEPVTRDGEPRARRIDSIGIDRIDSIDIVDQKEKNLEILSSGDDRIDIDSDVAAASRVMPPVMPSVMPQAGAQGVPSAAAAPPDHEPGESPPRPQDLPRPLSALTGPEKPKRQVAVSAMLRLAGDDPVHSKGRWVQLYNHGWQWDMLAHWEVVQDPAFLEEEVRRRAAAGKAPIERPGAWLQTALCNLYRDPGGHPVDQGTKTERAEVRAALAPVREKWEQEKKGED